jgi:endonuclease/exonuclease/phosphatase family metal-dependent hydrolase
LKIIKKFVVGLLTILALAVALLLLAVGYSDRVSPVDYPFMGCVGMAIPIAIALNLAMLLLMLMVCWRRAWIPLLAFVFAYVPIRTYIPLHFDSEPPADCLKLVSYNVCTYGGNFKYDHGIDTVTAYIMAQQPDIVCIQEDMSTKFKPVEKWQELMPYNDTVNVNFGRKEDIAVGIHTRFPILKKELIDYTAEANGSVAFFLLIGQDTVIVINNHLESTHLTKEQRERYSDMVTSGPSDRRLVEEQALDLIGKLTESMVTRAPEAEAVHQYIEAHTGYPIIVCGDFNDTPISYARHTIAQGLTDCYAESGCGLGLSYNKKGFNFRIDHVFCTPHFTPYKCVVDSKMDASDHYPVLCWLKMTDKP